MGGGEVPCVVSVVGRQTVGGRRSRLRGQCEPDRRSALDGEISTQKIEQKIKKR